jgi:hypothetical protein
MLHPLLTLARPDEKDCSPFQLKIKKSQVRKSAQQTPPKILQN